MSESSIESVIYVCRAESNRLRQLVADLDAGVTPRRLDGLLRELGKCADTLSAALTRVSAFVDHLEGDQPDAPEDAPEPPDGRLIDLVQRLKIAVRFGVCEICGGVRADGGGHGRIEIEPDAAAAVRAHRADAAEE